jgi:hypothetical protein
VDKHGENLLRSCERKDMRNIFGMVLENSCWRRCRNPEIYKLFDEYDAKLIKLGRLRWVGHVMRVKESDPTKKALCTKPRGGGDRPKLRRHNNLEEDIAQVGCRNWRTSAQSRQEWQKLSEEVKCQWKKEKKMSGGPID